MMTAGASAGTRPLRGLPLTARALVSTLLLLLAAFAGTAPAGADPAFRAFIEALWPDAEAQRISRATFDRAFRGIEPDLSLPDLDLPGRDRTGARGQAEFTRTPEAYVDRVMIERLATRGRELARQYTATLDDMERQLAVDRATVLAIWGRETAYGTHKPRHNAIRALATLAWVGRRKDLFRVELLSALRLVEDGILAPEQMRSSWAGAMGLTQFLPSEFYGSGHDLDGDGRIDLFGSIPDALGSAAKQLKQKGWVHKLPWGIEVRTGRGVDCAEEGPRNERPLAEWVRRGVVTADGRPFPAEHMGATAYLMSPAGTFGPQFLVTENFKVIRAYNTSDLYALFVGHLSDRIAGRGQFQVAWSRITQMQNRDIEEIQSRLKSAGHDIDKVDGRIGSNTRWQIGLYQRKHGLAVDCWPTDGLLRHLRGSRGEAGR